jgi:hypothetical protein
MANTTELLPNSQQAVSNPWRHTCGLALQRRVLVFILIAFCAAMLTGCKDFWDKTADLFRIDGGGGEADAQDQDLTEVRIKTYIINPEEFEVVLDNDIDPTPEHLISDSATELTMRSAGTLVRGTGAANIALEAGDILILRLDGSNNGTVTLIRQD